MPQKVASNQALSVFTILGFSIIRDSRLPEDFLSSSGYFVEYEGIEPSLPPCKGRV